MAQPRRTVHPDTRTGTDRTGSTVAADEPLGTHGVLLAAGAVLQHGAHAFLVLGEAQQAHAEPDPVGRRLAGPPQQDRLQRVLGTDHARRRRAHVAVRRIVGNAAAYEVRVDQIPAPVEENLGGRQAGGADLVFESAASEDLHRAGGDPAGLGMREVSGRASASRWSTPYRDSRFDRVRPTGPPPTMSTGVVVGECMCSPWGRAVHG